MRKIILINLLLGLFISGCASMNKDECMTADWYLVGFEDGSKGENPDRIGDYRKDCAAHGVGPDLTKYRAGHDEGSKSFCTAQNGFERAAAGNGYNKNCPAELERLFLQGFQDGQQLHDLSQDVANLERQIRELDQESDKLNKHILQLQDDMIADGLTREQRVAIREDIIHDQDRLAEVQQTLEPLYPELALKQTRFERMSHAMKKKYW